jgi:hypothetical protein
LLGRNTNIKVDNDITKKKRVATPFDDQSKPPWLSEVESSKKSLGAGLNIGRKKASLFSFKPP